MNRGTLRNLVEQKSRHSPASCEDVALALIRDLIDGHPDVDEYVRYCLPQRSYQASGVGVLDLQDILEEMHPEAAPGGLIRPFGYLIVASSPGGNAVCFQCATGKVFWVDHESFVDGEISFQNRSTDQWEFLHEYSPENVERAMVPLSDNIETFLIALLTDELTARFDDLD